MSALASSRVDPSNQRDLAVAWMNRGHSLALEGTPTSLESAIDAYQEAILRLRPLVAGPGPADPSWATSLGAALMNRGALLYRVHGTAHATLALAAFDEAVDVLAALPAGTNRWPRRNLAGTLLNRANLLIDLGQLAAAATAAREALALSVSQERSDVVDADVALKARRTLCDALGRLIVQPGADQQAIATEASDVVEDGLALARYWTNRGLAQPRELELRLFHFGAQLYRFHQPHFLAEFLAEGTATRDPELVTIALQTIEDTLSDRPYGSEFLTVGDPVAERHLRTARDLAALRASLQA